MRRRSFTAWAGALTVATIALTSALGAAEDEGGIEGNGGPPATPEQQVIHAMLDMRRGQQHTALQRIEELVVKQPNFRLAHLLRADLTGTPTLADHIAASEQEVAALREEARARLRGYLERPPAASWPSVLLRIPRRISTLAVVDLDKYRLYLYENQDGTPHLTADYYVAGGKNGLDKRAEGDRKTPVGIYAVTSHLPGRQLPDLYGSGAFPISYPNPWDRFMERTGSGIWIHGTESALYSRPPRSSDGCLTLSNSDFEALARHLGVDSPVIITRGVQWTETSTAEATRREAEARLEVWRTAWEQIDTERYLAHYSTAFKAEGKNYTDWVRHKRRVNAGKRFIEVELDDIGIYRYPGEENLLLVEFLQRYRSSNFSSTRAKLQYWRREDDGRWRILYEGGT